MGGWRILWCLTQISQIGIGFTQKLKTSAYVDTKTITLTCIREKQSILETICKKAKNAINKANLNELWFWDIWLIQSSKQQTIVQKHFTRSTVFSLSKKKKKPFIQIFINTSVEESRERVWVCTGRHATAANFPMIIVQWRLLSIVVRSASRVFDIAFWLYILLCNLYFVILVKLVLPS